jgi:hypothetical protein
MAIPFLNNINLDDNQLQNAKLHVTASAPTAAAGQIYFDSTVGVETAKYYDGSGWISLVEHTFNNGTYINLTEAGTDATRTLTADLSAVDGTAAAGERYLTKNNTWAEVAAIPGTYSWDIAGDSGSETVASGDTITFAGGTNVTTSYDSSTNTLTINSTDQYTGTVTGTGTATQVAFWDATSSISSDSALYWDNTNKRLGIGIDSSIATDLHIKNSTTAKITLQNTNTTNPTFGSIDFKNNAGETLTTILSGQNPGISGTRIATYTYSGGSVANYTFLDLSSTNLRFQQGTSTNFIIDSTGQVGIGTTNPTEKLHVDGNVRITGAIYDSSNGPGTSGQILSSTATGTDWIDQSSIAAGSANTLTTARDFSLTGDVTAPAISFDGSGNVALSTTIAAGAVEFSMLDAAAVITQAEGIENNDNDTTIPTSAAVKDYVDSAVVGGLVYQGGYDASTNTPNLDNNPSPNNIKKGWTYTVTADGSFFTEQVRVGDVLIAEVDTPTALGDWTTVQNNIDLASLTQVGIGNVNAGTGIGVSYTSGTATVSNTGVTSLAAGEGIDVSGSTGAITVSAEDSSATNKGIVIVSPGEAIDVSYSSGTATVSVEDSTASNKGAVIVAGGTGISVSYASGTATVTNTDSNSDNTFSGTIGDGASTSLTVTSATHGLGTDSSSFMIQLVEVSSGETVYADVTRGASGLVTVDFATAPATNAIRVLIQKIG